LRVVAGCLAIALLALFAPLNAAETGDAASPAPVPAVVENAPAANAFSGIDKVALTPAPAPEDIASATSMPASVAQSPPITLTLKADLSAQKVTVLEGDAVAHEWPISSGMQGYATPTGIFQPQWASKLWYSRQWDYAPMPHAVFFNSGVAFHGTTAVWRLGKSASHGCLRLSPANAKALFMLVHKHGFAQTRVIVFGTPPQHGTPPPASAANRRPGRDPSLAANAPSSKSGSNSGLPDWAKFLRY
jgi:lipoprotein-anchoring transpeptidase ErfK/SrfK